MHLKFQEEQEQFKESFASLLMDKCTPEKVRKAWEEGSQIAGLWESIANLGALGLQAPEKVGGLNMGEVEFVLLMETAGYHALPEPFLEHAAVAIPAISLAAGGSPAMEWLQPAVEGKKIISAGSAISQYIAYGELADAFLLVEGDDLYLLPKEAVKISPQKSLEASRAPCRIDWKPDRDFLLEGADAALAFNRGALAAAAECLGLAQRLLDMSVEYVKERNQFGKPVGAQQAVKHHLADVAIALEHARPSVYAAACAAVDKMPSQARDISAAKSLASDTASMAARKALQCHGAIGYTMESDLGIWLKKSWVAANSWGSSQFHLERVAKDLCGESRTGS